MSGFLFFPMQKACLLLVRNMLHFDGCPGDSCLEQPVASDSC